VAGGLLLAVGSTALPHDPGVISSSGRSFSRSNMSMLVNWSEPTKNACSYSICSFFRFKSVLKCLCNTQIWEIWIILQWPYA
jgi:hypothetical protein